MTIAMPARAGVPTDVANVWWRETLTIVRDPFSLIFSLLQPLVFLGLFGPLLSGLAGDGSLFGGFAGTFADPSVLWGSVAAVVTATVGRTHQSEPCRTPGRRAAHVATGAARRYGVREQAQAATPAHQ